MPQCSDPLSYGRYGIVWAGSAGPRAATTSI